MASWQSPQLHTDGHLDGQEGEILLLLSCLELHQHLVELEKKQGKIQREKIAEQWLEMSTRIKYTGEFH